MIVLSNGRGGLSEFQPPGIPKLRRQDFGQEMLRQTLRRFDEKHKRCRGKVLHFFMDDGKFERVWNYPQRYLDWFRRYAAVCTPDYSLYRDMPLALQLFNVYRNRWCGRFWQEHGIRVIPTISWSDERSHSYCFEGVPQRQILAVGTPDLRNEEMRQYFATGIKRMLKVMKPVGLIIYGQPAQEFSYEKLLPKSLPYVIHPHHWQRLGQLSRKHGARGRISENRGLSYKELE